MNNKLKLLKNDQQALDVFKKQIKSDFSVDKPELILFGSKARGDFKKHSDVDLLVVLKKATLKKKTQISNLATDLFFEFNANLSPHIYSKKEFQNLVQLQTPFTLMVKQEGIKL